MQSPAAGSCWCSPRRRGQARRRCPASFSRPIRVSSFQCRRPRARLGPMRSMDATTTLSTGRASLEWWTTTSFWSGPRYSEIYMARRVPQLRRQWPQGRDVLFDIDWQGTQQLREKARGDMASIFVLPPTIPESRTALTRSVRKISEHVIQERMAKAARGIEPLAGIRLRHHQQRHRIAPLLRCARYWLSNASSASARRACPILSAVCRQNCDPGRSASCGMRPRTLWAGCA